MRCKDGIKQLLYIYTHTHFFSRALPFLNFTTHYLLENSHFTNTHAKTQVLEDNYAEYINQEEVSG